MGEVLDGGVVTYRACRTFDVLEENLLFDLQSAAVASDYRNAFDERRDDPIRILASHAEAASGTASMLRTLCSTMLICSRNA